jgi:N-acetylated-alpha-linked acidic dipeptidase
MNPVSRPRVRRDPSPVPVPRAGARLSMCPLSQMPCLGFKHATCKLPTMAKFRSCCPSPLPCWRLLYTLCLLLISCCQSDFVESSNGRFSDNENIFLSAVHSSSARDHLKFITSMPHVAGTPGDYMMAEYVKNSMLDAGIPEVSQFELEVFLNYPSERPVLKLLDASNTSKTLFEARLSEELLDSTSDTHWRNHTFHGYAPSGDVTAPLVFANYGRPIDFSNLEQNGVNVNNTIVIVRYGRCFRGLKVRNAQMNGAKGVLIYSDPADDGYAQGKVYPNGPWRPATGVQRGSVQFNSACAGDPMRADPRYAARNDTLMSICGISNYTEWIPKVPSLPISYGDAMILLGQLRTGPTAIDVFGDDFDGALPFKYKVGPSNHTVVQLTTNNHESITTIPNVVARIPGSLSSSDDSALDMPVLLGNHRDAWVYGAADPNSGTAALLEVASGLGHLISMGWQPRRSIYLLSWSGEEYGLLGSTGWAELEQDKIKNAVAYLNADTIVSGDLLSVGNDAGSVDLVGACLG